MKSTLKQIQYLQLLILFLFVTISYSQNTNVESDNPYNPVAKMDLLKKKNGKNVTSMHFLVFGDSKGSPAFKQVLKRADSLAPEFCLTTADLVKKGGGEQGKIDYVQLDADGGWFMRKYPMWPTVGNHESLGGDDALDNFSNFFGMEKSMYSFEYGNAKFIALPWPKIKEDEDKLAWLESELKAAKGKHIFIFKHRPHYDVGSKKTEDVEGTSSATTKLYDKYNVTAVFSGHDHIYYRTKRNATSYIISAGAGANIYALKREAEVIKGDAYYGKRWKEDLENSKTDYKFVASDGTTTDIAKIMFYVLSVKIDGDKVLIQMIDSETGKIWDEAVISKKERKILVAAHRGGYEHDFEDKAPENSIANIQNAINHGFDMYESDVQRTADGKFIIMHDPTLDRTTNGNGEVAKMTFDEMKNLKLTYINGEVSEEKIPLLSDFISKGDGNIIFKIDYKPELKYLGDLLKEIKELGLQDRVILRFKYKKETAEYLAKYDQTEIPTILFRVNKMKQYKELKGILPIKMISVFEKKEFNNEELELIKLADKDHLQIEVHTFYDRKNKEHQEALWLEQAKLPISIFHTNKPILVKEFLDNHEIE